MLSIVLTGGGTAGHVIPCLNLVPDLKEKFDKIYYIGSKDGIESELVKKADIDFYPITCVKLKRKLTAENLKIPFKLCKGILDAKKILKRLNPSIVFSKGGYVALPVVIAAHQLKIPVISHESDITAGLANKIASKYSVLTLTSFLETAKEFKNGLHVGCPIKKDLDGYDKRSVLSEFNFDGTKPVLLAFGGSLGSTTLNNAIISALQQLKVNFDVLHVTGRKNFDKFYKSNGYTPLPYIDDMRKAYSVADVIVSRCGANSAFEILSLRKPVVFIPLSKSESRGDQILNAEYFMKNGCAYLLPEDLLTDKSLAFAVNAVYHGSKQNKLAQIKIDDASKKIVSILYENAKR
jgi:UDP-N-acetylglucosamine--N-acetylmuramyl-(pentapeptide) pyrophosphoryl-undecaprenol N-acetylglucosamine transferase